MNVSLLKESKLFSSDRKSRSGSHSGSRSTRRISSSVLMAASAAAAAHLPPAAAAATEDCPPAPIQEESPDEHGRPKCARSKTNERNVSRQNKLMPDGKFSGSQSYITNFVLIKTKSVLISKLVCYFDLDSTIRYYDLYWSNTQSTDWGLIEHLLRWNNFYSIGFRSCLSAFFFPVFALCKTFATLQNTSRPHLISSNAVT